MQPSRSPYIPGPTAREVSAMLIARRTLLTIVELLAIGLFMAAIAVWGALGSGA